jgi:hypothetical protein
LAVLARPIKALGRERKRAISSQGLKKRPEAKKYSPPAFWLRSTGEKGKKKPKNFRGEIFGLQIF